MAFDNSKYQSQYIRENYRQINLKISKEKEPELIEWLEKQSNMQMYLKDLIRQDLENHTRT